ncbi:MAG: TetR/AcrR family transcriptional regulator [Verrucomicrobiales bacterium]|nr:TetR/AcrR family transcriptional regulator [Verrucomicrobiales bacterium]
MATEKLEELGTRDRLLDVAETLVAAHGFDAVSLRQVTSDAGANLAAVNYHFGSRDGLFQAAIGRRVEPINRERLQMLDDLEAGGEPGIEAVLGALFRPVVNIYRESEKKREVFFRFMGRCMGESSEAMTAYLAEQFGMVVERFTLALGRAMPGVAAEEVRLRFLFSVGVMAHTLCFIQQMSKYTGKDEPELTAEELMDRMVAFSAAGMRAEGGGR